MKIEVTVTTGCGILQHTETASIDQQTAAFDEPLKVVRQLREILAEEVVHNRNERLGVA